MQEEEHIRDKACQTSGDIQVEFLPANSYPVESCCAGHPDADECGLWRRFPPPPPGPPQCCQHGGRANHGRGGGGGGNDEDVDGEKQEIAVDEKIIDLKDLFPREKAEVFCRCCRCRRKRESTLGQMGRGNWVEWRKIMELSWER